MQSIEVTRPFLPPLEEYMKHLEGIWERSILTNKGPLSIELEERIQAFHRTERSVVCVANAGLGLQIALRALGVEGEIITTPFTYVATAACPLWQGNTVRFADIEPDYLTICPEAVESAITPKTEAILAVHLFGNPCNVGQLQKIADRHGLALVYDAAQAFGVRHKGKSILDYGDASVLSLHATKVFHAAEGGAMAFKDPDCYEKAEWMRRYGHNGPGEFYGIGINAKISELHAAMGLSVLPFMDEIQRKRQEIINFYRAAFESCGQAVCLPCKADTSPIVGYAPIVFKEHAELEYLRARLLEKDIRPRRYFKQNWISASDGLKLGSLPVYSKLHDKILCLPIFPDLPTEPILEVIEAFIDEIE